MNNEIHINDTDRAVAEFLKANNIRFIVSFSGSENDGEWPHDDWNVKIQDQKFDFKTGIGHRITKAKANGRRLSIKQINQAKQLKDLLGKDRLEHSTIYPITDGYAVCPTQASVLSCLLSDASSAEQNFNDWCSDLGYDSDSISNFQTYQACCLTLEKIRKVFTLSQRHELQELLQYY